MVKKKEILEEKKYNCEKNDDCTCDDNCTFENHCKCSEKKYYLKVFVVSIIGVLLFLSGLIVGALLLFNNELMEDSCTKDIKCEEKDNVDYEDPDDISDYDMIVKRIHELGAIEQVSRNINSVKDFTNQELLLFAVNYLGYDDSYTLQEINDVVNRFFGTNIKPENVNCHSSADNIPILLYDKDKKIFISNPEHDGHGIGGYYSYVLNKVVSYEIRDNIYTVKVKKAFGATQDTGPITTFYKTYKEMAELGTPIIDFKFNTDEDLIDYEPEVYFNNLSNDKMLTYTYVFEKVDSNFVLKSYKFY